MAAWLLSLSYTSSDMRLPVAEFTRCIRLHETYSPAPSDSGSPEAFRLSGQSLGGGCPLPLGSPSVYNRVMARSNSVKHKKRGPPPTGVNPIMAFRPMPPLRAAVAAYAKANEVTVSEAVRRLIELGLKAKGGKL